MKKIFKLISISMVALSLTSCYQWWENQIGLDTTKQSSNLAEFFYKEHEITSLDVPEQVIASPGYYSNTVKIRWSEVENATSYRIERACVSKTSTELPDEGEFEVLNEYVYDTTYTDTILSNPTYTSDAYNNKYYYRISAENIGRGLESSEFTDITQPYTNAVGWLLPPPTGVDASKGDSPTSVTVKWNKVEGANQYKIYRGESQEDFKMVEIATVRGSQNTYTNTISEKEKGTEFYYQVSAIHSIGAVSAKSSYAMGYSLVDASLLPPSNLTVDDSYGKSKTQIKLKWDTPAGANTDITYSVYKTTNVDSTYRLVKQNIAYNETTLTDDNNLKPGVLYYYYIQSVKKVGDDKQKSAFTKKGPVGFILSAPTSVEVGDYINSEGKISDQYVNVRWEPALGAKGIEYDGIDFDQVYSYNIYYSDDLDGDYSTKVNDTDLNNLEMVEGFYEYKVPKKGFYKVSTINNGQESEKSSTVAPLPDAPNYVTATKTEGGELITGYSFDSTGENYNTNEVYPVKITWQAPSSNPVPVGYNIYRSTKRDSSFRKLNEDLITDCYFVDLNETARAGTYYYYKVVSVNILSQGKKSNDPVTDTENSCRGYGALTRNQWFREYNATIMRSQSKLSLMHKPNDMDKLGSETISGDYSGTLSYNAAVAGLGAEIVMHYENYCDFMASNDQANGPYFLITGNTDTTSNMSANGNMHGTVTVTGMYPGIGVYNTLEIKGGAAGGGGYGVTTKDLKGNVILDQQLVKWQVGEESKK